MRDCIPCYIWRGQDEMSARGKNPGVRRLIEHYLTPNSNSPVKLTQADQSLQSAEIVQG